MPTLKGGSRRREGCHAADGRKRKAQSSQASCGGPLAAAPPRRTFFFFPRALARLHALGRGGGGGGSHREGKGRALGVMSKAGEPLQAGPSHRNVLE